MIFDTNFGIHKVLRKLLQCIIHDQSVIDSDFIVIESIMICHIFLDMFIINQARVQNLSNWITTLKIELNEKFMIFATENCMNFLSSN